jgi:predicted MPP superfamily phosphohydrolase
MRTRDAAAGVLAAGAACVAYGTFVEARWFRRRDLDVPGAVRTGGPLRVLQVADTHLTPPEPRMERFLAETVEDADPDLVVAAGDLLGAVGAEDATVDLLAPLTAGGRPGVAVLGSNDLWGPRPKSPFIYMTRPDDRRTGPRLDTDRFVAGLRDTGWTVLRDDWAVLDVAGRRVLVSGMEDPHLDGWVPPDPDALVPGGPTRPGRAEDHTQVDLHLGLVHAPYVAAVSVLTGLGADVVLAGHTHGGQVRLPGIGALVGNCDLPLDRVRGLSRWDEAWLHVTPGMGQSRYAPYRFGCRPEATVLDLG